LAALFLDQRLAKTNRHEGGQDIFELFL